MCVGILRGTNCDRLCILMKNYRLDKSACILYYNNHMINKGTIYRAYFTGDTIYRGVVRYEGSET